MFCFRNIIADLEKMMSLHIPQYDTTNPENHDHPPLIVSYSFEIATNGILPAVVTSVAAP